MRDRNAVARAHVPAMHDDGHHASPHAEGRTRGLGAHPREQPGLIAVDVHARAAQPCELDDRFIADAQPGAGGQCRQVDAARGQVLAQVAGEHPEAFRLEFVEQLAMDQVHLAQVGASGVAALVVAVLHRCAAMRVAFHAQAGQQPDAELRGLAEPVHRAQVRADDERK
jgi:hypothetical protein